MREEVVVAFDLIPDPIAGFLIFYLLGRATELNFPKQAVHEFNAGRITRFSIGGIAVGCGIPGFSQACRNHFVLDRGEPGFLRHGLFH